MKDILSLSSEIELLSQKIDAYNEDIIELEEWEVLKLDSERYRLLKIYYDNYTDKNIIPLL